MVAAASGLDRLEVEARIPLDADADEALRVEFDRGVDSVLDFLGASLPPGSSRPQRKISVPERANRACVTSSSARLRVTISLSVAMLSEVRGWN